jgi:hypothetical protein
MGVPEDASGGYCLATSDVSTIKRWWSRWPKANVGIALRESGLAVVEADLRHDGLASLAALIRELDIALDTVEAVSASGGPHHYFAATPGLPRVLGLVPGVDILPVGYVVAPPSRREGRSYAWRGGRAPWQKSIACLPQAISDRVWAQQPRPRGPVDGSRWNTNDSPIARFKSDHAIEDVIGQVVALKARGGGRYLLGVCPFHPDTDPSFAVFPRDGHFHCFGCSAHGDVLDFLTRWRDIRGGRL